MRYLMALAGLMLLTSNATASEQQPFKPENEAQKFLRALMGGDLNRSELPPITHDTHCECANRFYTMGMAQNETQPADTVFITTKILNPVTNDWQYQGTYAQPSCFVIPEDNRYWKTWLCPDSILPDIAELNVGDIVPVGLFGDLFGHGCTQAAGVKHAKQCMYLPCD